MELQVQLLSPAKPVAKVRARSVILPGSLGYMTVLPGHAALISELDVGRLTIDKVEHGETLQYFISGGYVSVENDQVTILADVVESAKEIDRSRAMKSKERALERLTNQDTAVDLDRSLESLRRAEIRLSFAEGA